MKVATSNMCIMLLSRINKDLSFIFCFCFLLAYFIKLPLQFENNTWIFTFNGIMDSPHNNSNVRRYLLNIFISASLPYTFGMCSI